MRQESIEIADQKLCPTAPATLQIGRGWLRRCSIPLILLVIGVAHSMDAPVLGLSVVHAATQQEIDSWKAQIASDTQWLATYGNRPGYQQIAAIVRQRIAYYTQLLQNANNNGNGNNNGNWQDPFKQQAENAKQNALAWLARANLQGKRWITITYRQGPIYQGQGWGQTYTRTVSVAEAQRYISMLANNGNLVIGLSVW